MAQNISQAMLDFWKANPAALNGQQMPAVPTSMSGNTNNNPVQASYAPVDNSTPLPTTPSQSQIDDIVKSFGDKVRNQELSKDDAMGQLSSAIRPLYYGNNAWAPRGQEAQLEQGFNGSLGKATDALKDSISTVNIPTSYAPTISQNLGIGSQGDDVTGLQKWLKTQGFYNGPATGNYGSLTQDAVSKWQGANGIGTNSNGDFGITSRAFTASGGKIKSIDGADESSNSNVNAIDEQGNVLGAAHRPTMPTNTSDPGGALSNTFSPSTPDLKNPMKTDYGSMFQIFGASNIPQAANKKFTDFKQSLLPTLPKLG